MKPPLSAATCSCFSSKKMALCSTQLTSGVHMINLQNQKNLETCPVCCLTLTLQMKTWFQRTENLIRFFTHAMIIPSAPLIAESETTTYLGDILNQVDDRTQLFDRPHIYHEQPRTAKSKTSPEKKRLGLAFFNNKTEPKKIEVF